VFGTPCIVSSVLNGVQSIKQACLDARRPSKPRQNSITKLRSSSSVITEPDEAQGSAAMNAGPLPVTHVTATVEDEVMAGYFKECKRGRWSGSGRYAAMLSKREWAGRLSSGLYQKLEH